MKGFKVGATNPEKINILNAMKFINVAWNIDVKTTTIAHCFRHCKICSDQGMASEPHVGKDEDIDGLRKAIYGL